MQTRNDIPDKVISDTTSLNAAMKFKFNVDDPESVDPCLSKDVLESIFYDANKVHVHGLLLIPFPYKHEPWHTTCEKIDLKSSHRPGLKICFAIENALLMMKDSVSFKRKLSDHLAELVRGKVAPELKAGSIKVLSVSADPPFAIISLPSYTSRDAFLSLTSEGGVILHRLLLGKKKLCVTHIKSNWDCGCNRTGEGCGICVEGANHWCWKCESWRPMHRSSDCPHSSKK